MLLLQTVNFQITATRLQPLELIFEGKLQNGSNADFSEVTSTKLCISHAYARDYNSQIVVYTDKFVVDGTVARGILEAADLESLPLGTFPAEFLVEHGGAWHVSHEGYFTFQNNLWWPF